MTGSVTRQRYADRGNRETGVSPNGQTCTVLHVGRKSIWAASACNIASYGDIEIRFRLTDFRHEPRISVARAGVHQGASMAGEDRNDRERLKAIELAVGQIEKQFGKGSIMRLGAKDVVAQIPAISTGAVSLDYALGIGGVPRGRVIEVFGPESSGKTTLALQVIAQAQKTGGMAAFVDAEHALDAQYAKKLGVDLDNLVVSQPDNGEQALEIVEVLIRSGGVDVVVIDSVAALVPRAEIEGEMGEAQMGLQARLMSQALRKLTGIVSKSKTCLSFINP